MKIICTFLAMIMVTSSILAQETESYDDLMKKSRKARTTSTIMVASGPVIAAGGIGTLIYGLLQNEVSEPDYIYDVNGNVTVIPAKKYTTEIVAGAAAAAVGIAVALTSIAFSNKAYNLKLRARKLKFKSSTDRLSIPGIQGNYANNRTTQLKFSLLIPLNR